MTDRKNAIRIFLTTGADLFDVQIHWGENIYNEFEPIYNQWESLETEREEQIFIKKLAWEYKLI